MAGKKLSEQDLKRARVNRAFSASCSGIQIPMMRLPDVMKVGLHCIDNLKQDDEALAKSLRSFVETIRA
jgi:hypothetical protein